MTFRICFDIECEMIFFRSLLLCAQFGEFIERFQWNFCETKQKWMKKKNRFLQTTINECWAWWVSIGLIVFEIQEEIFKLWKLFFFCFSSKQENDPPKKDNFVFKYKKKTKQRNIYGSMGWDTETDPLWSLNYFNFSEHLRIQ